jgi:hypothetical protein
MGSRSAISKPVANEGGLEVEDKRDIATDENGIADVDGEDVEEIIYGDGEDGRIHDDL